MRGCRFFLILVLAILGAKADELKKPLPSTSASSAPRSGEVVMRVAAPSRSALPPGLVAGLHRDMVSDVRATRAFIHEGAREVSKSDVALLMLAAIGSIVLQLRRTHKLLPQRSIIAYSHN